MLKIIIKKKVLRFSTSTTLISAEGCALTAEIVKCPQFFNSDHADLRRGSRAQIKNSKKGFNIDHADLKCPQVFNVDHTDPRRGLIFVECCRPCPAALRREERNLKLLMSTLMSMAPRQ